MADRRSLDERLLLTIPEIVEATGLSYRHVQRWLKLTEVSEKAEKRPARTRAGNYADMWYLDAATLPYTIPADTLKEIIRRRGLQADQHLMEQVQGSETLEGAVELIRSAPEEARKPLIDAAIERFNVARRTVNRRLAKKPSKELQPRSDAGRYRIPQAAYQACVMALVSNEKTASTRSIWRALMRAVPEVMRYERGGVMQDVSVRTLQRIRNELNDDPRYQLLFSDADERAEFLRTYSGSIAAPHANALLYIDMTRCDVAVVDLQTGWIGRPRMHVAVDVYSGCVPGIVFSREEDQVQTDLLLLRTLLPKKGPFAHTYPVWGKPLGIRSDNGPTYVSKQTTRLSREIGIPWTYGTPGRPHGGGPVERFFGSAHNFEKTLVGYVGPDAKARSTKELKRLEKNTREWLKHKRDPGPGNRLLTINEYQNAFLAWLVGEYHQWDVGGETRLERFVNTAPESTLIQLDERELLLRLAHRVERVVDPAGRFQLENRKWTILDGSLAPYKGATVTVLTDQFVLEPDRHLVAWKDRLGNLTIIGEAQPAPEVADSIEAQDHRRASRIALLEEARRQKELKRDLTNPHLRISNTLLKDFLAVDTPEITPGPRAQIEPVTDPALQEPAPDDALGRAIAAIQRPKFGPDADPLDIVRFHNKRAARGESDG